jgi:hypothetical protein
VYSGDTRDQAGDGQGQSPFVRNGVPLKKEEDGCGHHGHGSDEEGESDNVARLNGGRKEDKLIHNDVGLFGLKTKSFSSYKPG